MKSQQYRTFISSQKLQFKQATCDIKKTENCPVKSGKRRKAKELLQRKQAPRQQEEGNACTTIQITGYDQPR